MQRLRAVVAGTHHDAVLLDQGGEVVSRVPIKPHRKPDPEPKPNPNLVAGGGEVTRVSGPNPKPYTLNP